MAIASSAIPSLHFCLMILLVLLLAPRLGCSFQHTSYIHRGKHFVLRSSDAQRPPPTTSCSTVSVFGDDGGIARPDSSFISSGDGGGIAKTLPVLHRQNPSSPLGMPRLALRGYLQHGGRLDRPHSRLLNSGATIPTIGIPFPTLPGASEFHVVVGYGTPMQKLAVSFDTTLGATLLQCKKRVNDANDKAFRPSQSSSIVQVPCGSPECPLKSCSGSSCTVTEKNGSMVFNATTVMDTLTLSQDTHENIRAICLESEVSDETSERLSGILDLSRDNHSLASRAPSSPDTVAFSYCLPSTVCAEGFLSIGAPRPERSRHFVVYTPIWRNAFLPNMYVVRLTKFEVGRVDIKIPYEPHAGNTLIVLGTAFTYLETETYVIIREKFKSQMTEFPVAPPMGDLDTCYNFTGLRRMSMPSITLWFEGWGNLIPGMEQMMYFRNGGNLFSVGCLAFAAASDLPQGITAVIGTLVQERTEVVYDVRGGKVGFSHKQCW